MSSEAIKVFVRVRPFLDNEAQTDKTKTTHDQIQIQPPNAPARTFRFDRVMGGQCTNEEFYINSSKHLISNFISGTNVCIFCYGQTGSGKTFTCGLTENNRDGLVQRSIDQIFRSIQQISISFYQIYLDDIFDLLTPNTGKLSIKENGGSFEVQNLTRTSVSSVHQALLLIHKGLQYRKIAETNQNLNSSRSHTILQIEANDARLLIFDLAGSERASKSRVEGKHFEELTKINQSLSYLGNLISAIHQKQSYLPTRVSTLNKIISVTLLRNTKTAVIATINPQYSQYQESISTLQFADRAKQIEVQMDQQMILENGWNSLNSDEQQLLKDYYISPNAGKNYTAHDILIAIKKIDKSTKTSLNDAIIDQKRMLELDFEGERKLLMNRITQLENQMTQFHTLSQIEMRKFRGLADQSNQSSSFSKTEIFMYSTITQLLKSIQQLHKDFERTIDTDTISENVTPSVGLYQNGQLPKSSAYYYKILPKVYDEVERFLNIKLFGAKSQTQFCTKLVQLCAKYQENPSILDDLAKQVKYNVQNSAISQLTPSLDIKTVFQPTETLNKVQLEMQKQEAAKIAAKERMATRKSYIPQNGTQQPLSQDISAETIPSISYFPDFSSLQQYLSSQVNNVASIITQIKVSQNSDVQKQLLVAQQQLYSLAIEHAADIFNFSRIIAKTVDFQNQKLNPNLTIMEITKEQFQPIAKIASPNPLQSSKHSSPSFVKDPRLMSPYQQKMKQKKEMELSGGQQPVHIPPQPIPLRTVGQPQECISLLPPVAQEVVVDDSDDSCYDQLAMAMKKRQLVQQQE